MPNISGQITLSGITDKQLVKIWEAKGRNEKSFSFLPNQMQPQAPPQGEQFYNNVIFAWTSEAGMQIAQEVITFLLKKEEQAAAAVR